ncbi:uncharacterized protein F5891DRAFT_1176113 [Suillus fuscotomentosus]|uniref:Uncharacterized protein n=1 Tax=Suillus fuscotomentosus TaxID=1912939 RepID=A0AAD4DUZ6_9AGAM|nr:uncharacterized protein F5891DRAFT_1176113 [Suillus fuscotomentosus]KAG1894362.1 hypothetical protein F5891DRAFT_1176113 [Suillus fuscotomentosus]
MLKAGLLLLSLLFLCIQELKGTHAGDIETQAPATSPASLRTVHQPVLKKFRGFALNAGDFETFIIALRPTHLSSLRLVHRPDLEKIRGFAANAGGFGAFCLPLGLYSSSLGTLSAI